jgi:PPOX class probable F420-dependent enzyme
MSLSESDVQFLQDHHTAAMITVARDGTPKAARVGIALVDGRLWSSGTADRVRTKRLRRDPRCTLFVTDPGYEWLALETTVSILDGPDAPAQNLQLFRLMQDRPSGPLSWFGGELDEEEFLKAMAEEQRLIYEFDVHRTYGGAVPPPK